MMKIEGSCHCGAISYQAEVDPGEVSICHCTDCQALTGSAFRVTVPAAAADFKLTAGNPKIYVKTADSGGRRIQAFCGDCGSPIYTTSAESNPGTIGIRVGTIRQKSELRPSRQFWRHSALPWVPAMEHLETLAGEA
jgi:hypothetical protein